MIVAYNIIYLQPRILSAIGVVTGNPADMSERPHRGYYRNGEPRLFSGRHGERGGVPSDPEDFEGLPPDQQAAQHAPDGNGYFYDSDYNQNYGDDLRMY